LDNGKARQGKASDCMPCFTPRRNLRLKSVPKVADYWRSDGNLRGTSIPFLKEKSTNLAQGLSKSPHSLNLQEAVLTTAI
jgi:hypothetical protein